MGEASLLALSSRYPRRGADAVAAWSSGTGFAGVFGYAWVVAFGATLGDIGTQAVALAVLPPAFAVAAFSLAAADLKKDTPVRVALSSSQRVRFGLSLWPVTGAIFAVYFAEYAMQSGVWAAMGFPVHSKSARDSFYELANWLYQAGVLCSRSSGWLLSHLSRRTLWACALTQAALLVFFALDAANRFWYDPSVYPLCFVVGLFGGAVYVFGFRALAASAPPDLAEIAMTCGACAADSGILLSNIIGLLLQSCLYDRNHVRGATVHHLDALCSTTS